MADGGGGGEETSVHVAGNILEAKLNLFREIFKSEKGRGKKRAVAPLK